MEYNYTKESYFAETLNTELLGLGISKILGISTAENNITLHCSEELTTEEASIVDTTILNHLGASINDLDKHKFLNRALVKDQIIAEMATENIARVYSGEWTEQDLVDLSSDDQLNEILANINALAYEIAYVKVSLISNPLITTEIKAGWSAKLASHFYN